MLTVKEKFKKWGFRGRIPYADRYDKEGRLQISWMCSLHYYFHRDKPNYVGCPFQIQFKGAEPGDQAQCFQAVCGKEYHNHDFQEAVPFDETNTILDAFRGRGRKPGETFGVFKQKRAVKAETFRVKK